jgi:hypothetical protein
MVGNPDIAGGEFALAGRRPATLVHAYGARNRLAGDGKTKARRRYLLPVVSLLVLALVSQFALQPVEAAFVTLEVNPSVEIGVDRRGLVVSAQGLDEAGKALLAAVRWTSLRQRPFDEVLASLTDRLIAENRVAPGGRVVVTVRAVSGEPAVQDISAQARKTVDRVLANAGVQAATVGTVVSNELYQAAARLKFSPADYYELAALGLKDATVVKVLALAGELGIDTQVFIDEMDTVAGALADLKAAGFTEEQALQAVRAALAADPTLEESSTIVAGVIDLYEDGVPLEQVMAILALQHDLALKLEPGVFLEEVTTLMAALADLYEANITGEAALALMRAAIVADPTLEESSTIVAGVIDLYEDGVPLEQVMAVLALQHDLALKLDDGAFLEEVTTLLAALADLYEANVTGETALALIRAAAGADPALQDIEEVIDAAIELVEAGETPAGAVAKVMQAVAADPSMQKLEELLGLDDDDEGKEEDPAGEGDDDGDDQDDPAPGEDEDDEDDADEAGADDEDDDDDAGPGGPPAGDRKQPAKRPG